MCIHLLDKKKKKNDLQKAGLEIFNSRQNRIQYEKHYVLTEASMYQTSIVRDSRETDKSRIIGKEFK